MASPAPATGYCALPFEPVRAAFERLVGNAPGGGALVVRRHGQPVVSLCTGTVDRAGRRPWATDSLALSFSTTKGAAAAVVHRLADRGQLDYDAPVATYWPEFGAGGKHRVTVRHLLTHRAGLSSVQAVARRAEDLLDHVAMEDRLAARAVEAPTSQSAYHAITYGWLLSGLVRRLTGRGLHDNVQAEIADTLGTDGLHIGAPAGIRARVAEPVGSALRQLGTAARLIGPLWTRIGLTRAGYAALHIDGFHRLFEGSDPPIWSTEMPAVNGFFSADGLARLYGALAGGGAEPGAPRLLSPDAVHTLGRVQVRTNDAVLGLRMRWRLGYHQAFGAGQVRRWAFGHYGYGGSGGWADPTTGLALGFVTNRIGSLTTPLGDLTLFRLNKVVSECAAHATGR
jgi:CubicO group peptidase (beta-lactamase class C family)